MNIEQLVKKAKSKDEFAVNELIRMFNPLVLKMVSSIYINGSQREDLIQEGYFTIIRAVETYNISSNSSFTAYVSNAIRKNYYYGIRKASKRNFDTSYEKLIEEGKQLSSNHYFEENIEDSIIKKEEHKMLKEALEKLSQEEREFILFCYNEGHGGIKRYSEMSGIKYVTLQKRKKSILKKLRKLLSIQK